MLKRQWLLAALVASSISAISAPASAAVGIYLDVAPPAPRYEVVPASRVGFVWAPGYWDWRNGRHVWVRGHWVRERRGMYWHPDRWEQLDGRWTLQRGSWNREEWRERRLAEGAPRREGLRDRDGDGVPDRYDRAPDNPRRQ
jgi:hypothetical protein